MFRKNMKTTFVWANKKYPIKFEFRPNCKKDGILFEADTVCACYPNEKKTLGLSFISPYENGRNILETFVIACRECLRATV